MKFWFLLASIWISGQLWGQSPTISAKADKNNILIGDYWTVEFTIQAPKGWDINFPSYANSLDSSGLEFIKVDTLDIQPKDGDNIYKQRVIFTAWEAGEKQLPALRFGYVQGGVEQPFSSKPLTVLVDNPALVDSTYIAGIKTIIAEPYLWSDYLHYLYYALAGLAGLGLLWGLWWLFKSLRKPRPLSIEEQALAMLDAIKSKNYLSAGNFVEYHTQISYTLRWYLQNRFKNQALSWTNTEIYMDLYAKEWTKDFAKDLNELLEAANLIKFAKASPLAAANEFAIQSTERLIKHIQQKIQESKQKGKTKAANANK